MAADAGSTQGSILPSNISLSKSTQPYPIDGRYIASID
jgi:hypothetical protein